MNGKNMTSLHTQVPNNTTFGHTVRCVKLTTHINLVPKLRKRGATPPLPQYVFMA